MTKKDEIKKHSLFKGKQLDPSLLEWVKEADCFWAKDKTTNEKVLDPSSERIFKDIEKTLEQFGKLYGYELLWSKDSDSYSTQNFSFYIYLAYDPASEYQGPLNGKIASFTNGYIVNPYIAERFPNLQFHRADSQIAVTMKLALYSDVVQEILKNHHYSGGIYSDNPYERRVNVGWSRSLFADLRRQVSRFQKKYQLLPRQLQPFLIAVEKYSRYASVKKMPTNRLNHIANGIKAGLNSDGAVWLAVNNIASKDAPEYADLPADWLEALV